MKKTDLEVLSLALLAAACGQKPENTASNTRSMPKAATAAPTPAAALSAEPIQNQTAKSAEPVRLNVKSSYAEPAFCRTGRGGGKTGSMAMPAAGRSGRTGGKTDC